MTDVLVLNAGFTPVDIISDRSAISMLYQEKAYTIIESEREMRSPSISFRVPQVVVLRHFKKIPKMTIGFSKLNVMYRDDMVCQYCGKKFTMDDLTIDHVTPRSRWQTIQRTSKRNWTSWLNCVCSCKWCNNAKGNYLLTEIKGFTEKRKEGIPFIERMEREGWSLVKKPFIPKYLPKLVVEYKKAEKKGWLPFCTFNIRLIYTQ